MSLLDDVLDVNVDEVEDLPDYVDPAAGRYTVNISKVDTREVDCMDKESGTKVATPVVQITYEIVAVGELANPADLAPEAGSLFSESFFMKNPAFFKSYLKGIFGADMAGNTFGDLLKELEGMSLELTVKLTRSKDGEKVYTNTRDHVRL